MSRQGTKHSPHIGLMVIVSIALLMTIVPAVSAQAGEGEGVWYTVKWGDTLGAIAVRHGTTVSALVSANSLRDPNYIWIGQRLWIPGASGTATPAPTSAPTEPTDGFWYTVRAGDTLGGLAVRYRTTISAIMQANGLSRPDYIRIGQRLWIPGSEGTNPTPDPTPTSTPDPPSTPAPTATPTPVQEEEEGFWYTVKSGDTLGAIAARFGTTTSTLVAANKLSSANLIYVGQRLWIPGASEPTATPIPTANPNPTSNPDPTAAPSPPSGSSDFSYGFQIHPWAGADVQQAINATRDAGFTWIKIQVPWKMVEANSKGQYDWGAVDNVINALHGAGLKVLVSVCKAPDWARSSSTNWGYDGPPANAQDLADFMGALAGRYSGRIQAIEVWNEQNLAHEWGGEPIDAARYVTMLRVSYQAIKARDASIYVIAGGLTPTGVNDGVLAIDDVVYLGQMYRAGLKSYMDGLGVHPSGYNNPPDATYGYQNAAEPAYKNHPSFFFQETMRRYRQVMLTYGDSGKDLWPTEFGWASSPNPVAGYEYAANVTETEQAEYLVRSLQMMKSWGYVGPAFVWNLNFNVACPGTEQAQFGVMGRPAYAGLHDMPK